MTTTTRETGSRLSAGQLAILLVVILADVLDLMDSTITSIAAPTIVREIGGGESLVKWLGAGYALALGVLLVVGGRLGDRYGKRRLFLIGIAGFTLASLACGLAFDPSALIVARILQGSFGAFLIPQGMSILITSLNRSQLPTVFSVFGPVLGASAVLGPIVAGVIIDADIAGLTWRPVFLINIALGVAGFLTAMRVLPKDRPDASQLVDGVGAGLLGLTMLGLIYGLIEGSDSGWGTLAITSLAVGVTAFLGFCLRQRRARNPLILPSLLGNRGFTSGLILGLGYFAAVNGFAYVISLFFQLSLGLTSLQASLALSPLMAGIIVASFLARPLIEALGRRLVVIGLTLTFAGAAGLFITTLALGDAVNAYWTIPSILVLGLGMGSCFSSIYDVAIGDVAPQEAGSASGSLSAVQQLAAAIGSAVVTSVYFGEAATHSGPFAFIVSIVVVGGIVAACVALVWLLPKRAQEELR
ncbi:MFS transporter [Microbacterium sp. STN6]|uniref:MFS transporter n=1 Tax=Microbacterium sp. STN6 TaxID=2995588 RepID=UPI0022608849|nr:MFS transporter [Microbacterium sp. STN6]MCX7522124.1 MFS transporter [Microbacterium sp. STN6]